MSNNCQMLPRSKLGNTRIDKQQKATEHDNENPELRDVVFTT